MVLRISWDPTKDEALRANKSRGNIGFAQVVSIFSQPHVESTRNDDPEQWMVIGLVDLILYTLIYEERIDDFDPYIHCVTFWKSSQWEKEKYEKEIYQKE